MTTSESPIDITELTRLANELFQAVPGQAVPATAIEGTSPVAGGELFDPIGEAGLADLPLSLVGAFGAPTDTTSAPAWLGGVETNAPPVPVSGPPAASDAVTTPTTSPGQVPTSGAVVEPTTAPAANPAPSPTADQLSAVPVTLTEVMGFVAGVPQALLGPQAHALQAETAAEPPPAQVGSTSLPDAGAPVAPTPPSLGIFEFHPEMLPSLAGTSATARPFDPYAIRRDFPILAERVNGRPLIWLDNGATTQKPQVVIDRLSYFYEHENSNIHRGAHALAARATDAYEDARDKVRRFINAASTSEIVFVRGATEAINLVAKSWGVAHVGAGDEVLVTHLEHHANIVPWQQLCQQVGATLKVAPVDGTGQIILSEFERLITPRTKMVAMTQVSNALGTVTPIAEMVSIARRHGATTLVDAAQSVLHMRVDVQALDADFLVFSGHKVFAPTGIGVVYGRSDVWAVTPPWQGGGNMIADVTFEQTVYQPPPNRFEAGTGNIADAVGLGAALDYVTAQGIDSITAYERELLEHGTAGLLSINGLHLIGTAPSKAAVLSFVIDGHTTEAIGQALDKDGIAVRAGHHCAQPILRRFGVESTVRASLAMYNTREDLDCLVESLRRLTAGQPRGI